MVAQKRGEDHHLVLAGGDLGDGQDLVLRLGMAHVHHGGGPRLVLLQHAWRAVAHPHGVVGRELALDVPGGHLVSRDNNTQKTVERKRVSDIS